MAVKCKHCGVLLDYVDILEFNYDGSDSWNCRSFESVEHGAVVLRTNQNWCGYESDRDERSETIRCPYCHQFPFYQNEVDVYEPVELVCFNNFEIEIAEESGEVG